jgi:hypothetical protein
MSLNHPSPVTAAFDTIHEEFRRLTRMNNDLCRQRDQALAREHLAKQERDDALRQLAQLRGQSSRQAAGSVSPLAKLAAQPQSAGVDVTDQVALVDLRNRGLV